MLMVFGGVLTGLAFLLVTQVDTLWQFYFLRGVLMACGFSFMGALVTNTSISIWFKRHRGRALGIANMGTSLGTLSMVPVTVWIITTWGWRSSFLMAAILTWIVVIIPAAILMRRRPEDMGLLPDGDPPAEAQPGEPLRSASAIQETPAGEPVWTRIDVIKTLPFWLLVVSYATANMAFQGINISVAPYTQDLGFGAAMVASVLSVRALVMLGVTPVWGFLSEYSHIPIIRVAPFLIQAVSCIFFIVAANLGFLWTAVIVYGTGFAGATLMQEVIWANYFGRLSLGTVRSTAIPLLVGFSAAGPVFMNVIFDTLGSYKPAFLIFLGFFLFSSALMWVCRPPRPRRWS
jgi:MFS family permease